MLRDLALRYPDHLGDPAFLASLLARPGLADALTAMLRTGEPGEVAAACLLVRDLVLLAPRHGLGAEFRDALPASPVVPALEALLETDAWSARADAVYTLGKTGSTGSLPALRRVFGERLETDPLLLSRLAGEIGWLERGPDLALAERMAASPGFLTRWAALDMFASWHAAGEADAPWLRLRERLRAEAHPLVRAEAESGADADVTFSDVETWFGNHLHAAGRRDYTVEELERFVADEVPRLAREREAWRAGRDPASPELP